MDPNTENNKNGENPFDITKSLRLIMTIMSKYRTDPLCAKYPVLPYPSRTVYSRRKNMTTKAIKPYMKPLPIVMK